MLTYSGFLSVLAVALPLLAAAPFVAAAAYILARLLQSWARGRERHAAGEPAPSVRPFVGVAESFDVIGAAPLGTVARRARDELLCREVSFDKLRRAGEGAPARILNLRDTGIRIGDGASMLRFGLEVLPTGRPAFRAETHCAVSDATRPKFSPGATVNVKFGIYGSPVVAVDYAS
ncbi:MAG: hypothetical protein LC795_12880 [Acidobacteria bacterium]|nr:hypothetical protein [Acidobacteriota bacterium]